MPQPKSWLSEIVEAFTDLGGKAPYNKLYAKIEERNKMNFSANSNWRSEVRRTIQAYSSDSSTHNPDDEDVFYSVHGLGVGTWGLRSCVPLTPTPALSR